MPRWSRCVVVGVVAFVTLAVLPSQGASAASTSLRSGCATPWTQYGTFLEQSESPMFAGPPGIDFSRQVQFRARSGVFASRTNDACRVEKAKFAGAAEVRQLQCGSYKSCSYTDWSPYVRDDTPKPEFRYPNLNAAWDPFSRRFQTWPVPGPPA